MATSDVNRPIIGILCTDIDFDIRDAYDFGTKYPYYISASFVKLIESAGGNVIPIWAGRDDKYYEDIMTKINGVLFPGAKFWFNDEVNGTAAYSARKIYDIAIRLNENGIYFPLFGITIGFQLFFYAASGGQTDSRREMPPFRGKFPLNFEADFNNSRLFREAQPYMVELLQTEPIAFYQSIYCVTEQILNQFNLSNQWTILSTADNDGIKFITSAEHKKYPFFGVMSHLQRIQFENCSLRTRNAVEASEFFANYFVEQARNNTNTMSNDERLQHSIFNFPITYVEPRVPQFKQVYLFEKNSDYPMEPRSDISN